MKKPIEEMSTLEAMVQAARFVLQARQASVNDGELKNPEKLDTLGLVVGKIQADISELLAQHPELSAKHPELKA